MANMGGHARAALFGILATVLLIATVCVLDESPDAMNKAHQEVKEEVNDAEYGTGYLEHLAKNLRKEDKHTKDTFSVENMMTSLQHPNPNQVIDDAMDQSLVNTKASLHSTRKETKIPNIDANGFPEVDAPDFSEDESTASSDQEEGRSLLDNRRFLEADMLLQEFADEDDNDAAANPDAFWKPSGQADLNQRLTKLKKQDDEKSRSEIVASIPGYNVRVERGFKPEAEDTTDYSSPLKANSVVADQLEQGEMLVQLMDPSKDVTDSTSDWQPTGQTLKSDEERAEEYEDFAFDEQVAPKDTGDDILEDLSKKLHGDAELNDFAKEAFEIEFMQAAPNKTEAKKLDQDAKQQKAEMTKPEISDIEKNSAALKAFSVLVKGKLEDLGISHKGAIAALILGMAQKSKLSPEKQYLEVISQEKKEQTHGFPKYIFDHIEKAMEHGSGILVVGHVLGQPGNSVHISSKTLGLDSPEAMLSKLSVPLSEFTTELAKVDHRVSGLALKKEDEKSSLTVKEYNTLFKPTCGGGGNCASLDEATCNKTGGCKWLPPWDGSI